MGAADAPDATCDAALARAHDGDDGNDSEQRPLECSPSLALVLHRSGGIATVADALAAAPAGGASAGCGVEPDAVAPLHALLRSAVPGLECAPPRGPRGTPPRADVAARRKASSATVLSALSSMLQRCPSSSSAAPARGVAASGLSHALSLLSAGEAGGGGAGGLPNALMRLLSPSSAMFSATRPLGKGGFGTVLAAVGAVDGRAVALKCVPFRSPLPPWAAGGALAAAHAPLLREARALAALSHAHVVRYHAAWVEPRWERLAAALATHVGAADAAAAGDMQPASPLRGRGRAQRTVLRIRDAAATSSEEEASPSSDDDAAPPPTCSVSAAARRSQRGSTQAAW